jgi:hypothetical protein
MANTKLAASAVTLLTLLSLAAAGSERNLLPAAQSRTLDPKAFGVRLLLGVTDTEVRSWSGKVSIDRGEILSVEGGRFREGDRAVDGESWQARSLVIRKVAAKKAAAKKALATAADKKAASGPSTFGALVTPTSVLVTLKAPVDATLSIETEHGKFQLPLVQLQDGSPRRYLEGQVEAQRLAPVTSLVDGPHQEDFPSAVVDGKGGAWVVYVEHRSRGTEISEALRERPKDFRGFIPQGGGDQVRLIRFAGGQSNDLMNVTDLGLDVWRPSVALDGDGNVVVAWSEQKDGNWDLYRRRFNPRDGSWSETKRLTNQPGTDAHVILATAPDGIVWMAWQSWSDGNADIWLAPVEDPSRATRVTQSPANEWTPALAIGKDGRIHVAYDSYQNGNYDVFVYHRTPNGEASLSPVADSAKFEARPSITVDAKNRIWVAYEERDANWGKDAENLVDGKGSSLYRSSAVRVVCLDHEGARLAADPVAKAPEPLRVRNSYPRLAVDDSGRVWLAIRHREEAIWGNHAVMVVGAVWIGYVSVLSGSAWSPLQPLSRSDGLLDNRPALVPLAGGPVLAFYNTDARLRHEVEMSPALSRRYYTHSGTPPGVVSNDIQVAALSAPTTRAAAEPTGEKVALGERVELVHPNEGADVERMRSHRILAGSKTYQLFRGEFHRHTEISQDGGSDGSLEDMWRYALDAGRLDWIGDGDHDNGGGKEYTWWLIQKTTDLYHNPPAFMPMFTYERSVAYPGGHRNVMFPKRGVRTLPRLVDDNGVRNDVRGVDEDAAMLYAYLNQLGGICAAHTTATGMGTDWRANDPKAEPIVEIFQGHRNSYEHLGAPRVARRPGEAIGGWKPLGMIWNALALQYRIGFQASSDHISTHISFAVAIAEKPTRESIFDAFQRRHCYGATDNILLDVRSGDHLMGDELDANGPVTLKVLAHGTAPIKRVDIIKDFVYVYTSEPHKSRVELTWTDEEKRGPGLSWYYVRVLQEDGEIAWGSPIWVHFRPGTTTGSE